MIPFECSLFGPGQDTKINGLFTLLVYKFYIPWRVSSHTYKTDAMKMTSLLTRDLALQPRAMPMYVGCL
jgi:membrane protein CcdC involved in cytochrome C biogenesis